MTNKVNEKAIIVKTNDTKHLHSIYTDFRFLKFPPAEFPYIGRLMDSSVFFTGNVQEYDKLVVQVMELCTANLVQLLQPSRWQIIWNCLFYWGDRE